MISPAISSRVHHAVRHAIQRMGADQRVELQIVALTIERVLIGEVGKAVIAAGFPRAEDRFGRWLNQFVARSAS